MMNTRILVRWLVWLVPHLVLGCGRPSFDPDSASSQLHNVFGQDDRQVIASTGYPYSAIGRLDSGCTGTLIAPEWVLTAAHCLVDHGTGRLKKTVSYFRPGYSRSFSEKIWIESIWVGSYSPEDQRSRDFAFLKLQHPAFGFATLPLTSHLSAVSLPVKIDLAGYSTDVDHGDVLSIHRACTIRSKDALGRLLHDCDSAAGVSGGPLLWFNTSVNQYEIVGMTLSEFRSGARESVYRDIFSPQYANVAIEAAYFSAAAEQILAPRSGASTVGLSGVFYLKNTNTPPPESSVRPQDGVDPPLPHGRSCTGLSSTISQTVLARDIQLLEDAACGLAAIAPRFVELAAATPHATLYDAGGSVHTHAVYLCSTLNTFKRGLAPISDTSRRVASQVCPILGSMHDIERYVREHHADLEARNQAVLQWLEQSKERTEQLRRLMSEAS